MKVRISGNKIRFRLKEPEVKTFEQEGNITETLAFGLQNSEQLQFSLRESESQNIAVEFEANCVVVFVPKVHAEAWTSTNQVGFEADVDTGKGKVVSVLVEKDFVCMDGREEDNEGSYPNPLANTNK